MVGAVDVEDLTAFPAPNGAAVTVKTLDCRVNKCTTMLTGNIINISIIFLN